jgi:hypothetical protein
MGLTTKGYLYPYIRWSIYNVRMYSQLDRMTAEKWIQKAVRIIVHQAQRTGSRVAHLHPRTTL